MATVVFTPDEQQMIANAINYGMFNQPGSWEQFQERLRNDWRRDGAVERALNDSTYGVGRELRGIARAFSDPGIGVEAAKQHYRQHGVVGGTVELAKSVVTSPFRAAGTVISEGGGLGDRPLQTLTGLAAFVPVGRLGTALAGAGARAAGRQGLANMLGRTAGSRGFTHAARGAEALDVFTGIEEWPLELGADVALDLGTSALARSLEGRVDLSADGPPPDVPQTPSQTTKPPIPPGTPTTQGPTTTLPLVPIQKQPEAAGVGIQFGQQPKQEPQALPGAVVPFVHELWQTTDGSVVMPQTPGSKRTFENTRKYAYGDPNDESSVGAMTIKRVPNPETGTYDNRHWQVWFNGGAFGEVNAENPIFIDKSHGIDSYVGARDAVLSGSHQPGIRDDGSIIAPGPTQIPSFRVNINSMWQDHQNNRRNREQRRQLRREERQQQTPDETNQEQNTQPIEQPDPDVVAPQPSTEDTMRTAVQQHEIEAEQRKQAEFVQARTERAEARKNMPEAVGKEDTILWEAPDGTQKATRVVYKIIEQDSAPPSHTYGGGLSYVHTPGVPQEYQNRKDVRIEDLNNRYKGFQPGYMISQSQTAASGPAGINENYDRLFGHHRGMLLEKVYRESPDDKGEAYRSKLQEELTKFGFEGVDIDAFDKPELIRQIIDDEFDPNASTDTIDFDPNLHTDSIALAERSNIPEAAMRTASNIALEHAKYLKPSVIDAFSFPKDSLEPISNRLKNPTQRNLDAMKNFLNQPGFPSGDRSLFSDGSGERFDADGAKRFENALFLHVYNTEHGVRAFDKMELDTNLPRVPSDILRQMLPHLFNFETKIIQSYPDTEIRNLSIANDLVRAVDKLFELSKEDGGLKNNVEQFLRTREAIPDLTITPTVRLLMHGIVAEPNRYPKSKDLWIKDYIARAETAIIASNAATTGQVRMVQPDFEAMPSKFDMLLAAYHDSSAGRLAAREGIELNMDVITGGQSTDDTVATDTRETQSTPNQPTSETGTGGLRDTTGNTDVTNGGGSAPAQTPEMGNESVPPAGTTSPSQDSDTGTDKDQQSDQTTQSDAGTDTSQQQEQGGTDTGTRGSDDSEQRTDATTPSGGETGHGHVPGSVEPGSDSRVEGDNIPNVEGEEQQSAEEATIDELFEEFGDDETEQQIPELPPAEDVDADAALDDLFDAFDDDDDTNLSDITAEQKRERDIFKRALDNYIQQQISRLEAQDRANTPQGQRIIEGLNDPYSDIYARAVENAPKQMMAQLQANPARLNTPFGQELLRILKNPPTLADDVDIDPNSETVLKVPPSIPIAESHLTPLHEPTALALQNHPDVSNISLNISDNASEIASDAQKLAVRLMKRATDITRRFSEEGQLYRLAFLLGDGTGAGKTISGLTFILDQIGEGRLQHLVIGPKKELYTNNYIKDMRLLGGPVNSMFSFNAMKSKQLRSKRDGIGFATYNLLTQRPNMIKNNVKYRLSQVLFNLTGVRAPLEVLNPHAYNTIEYIKQIGQGQLPDWTSLKTHYDTLSKSAQRSLRNQLPENMKNMLIEGDTDAQPSGYASQQKIIDSFDKYDQKNNAVSTEDFRQAAQAYDGVILFDESHYAKGDSTTAEVVGIFTSYFPNARIVFMSATPVTKAEQLVNDSGIGYRLGLWGEGTPFEDETDFMETFAVGEDLALREVIARDLKGMGHYLRRTLSMEGINWHERKFTPTPEEIDTYDHYVRMIHRIKDTMESWVDRQSARLGKEATFVFKGQVMNQFWNFQQTFFASLQSAHRVRQLLPEIKEKLDAGNKVAVQLSTTGQAYQERGYTPTLKGMLISFLNRPSSPIYRRKPIGTGNVAYYKEDGKNVVYSDQMLAEKNNLITLVNNMPELPLSPIDILHSAVRGWGYNSHELTGREQINIESADGEYTQVNIDKDSEKMEQAFRESSDLNFVVIGDAGGEGRNLQTLREDSPIWHYDIESGWNPIQVVQKFGRSHRTGAAHKPEYVLVFSDSPASMRQVAGVRAKLTEMGALAAGQASQRLSLLTSQSFEEQDANEDNTEIDRANYIFGKFGKQAIANLIRNWYRSYQTGDETVGLKMQMLGLTFKEDGKGGLSDYPTPEQFISHLYQVSYENQAILAQEFFDVIDGRLALASDQGTLDTGVAQVKTHHAHIAARQQLTVHEDSGTPTEVVQVAGSTPRPRFSWAVVEGVRTKQPGFEGMAGSFARYARNTKSGRIYAFFTTGLAGDLFGETKYKQFGTRGAPRYVSMSQDDWIGSWETLFGSAEEIRDPEARSQRLAAVQQAWENEDQQLETRQPLSLTMITGVLMPVWDKIDLKVRDLNMSETDDVIAAVKMSGFRSVEEMMNAIQMRQVTLSDGSSLQGRIVPAAFLKALFERFGINIDKTPFKDIETLPVVDEATRGLENIETTDMDIETESAEISADESTETEPEENDEEARRQAIIDMGLDPDDMPDDFDVEQDYDDFVEHYEEIARRDRNDDGYEDTTTEYKRARVNLNKKVKDFTEKIGDTATMSRVRAVFDDIVIDKKHYNFIGSRVDSPEMLAVLAQVYRNPGIESTRVFYLKNGKIISHEGFSLNHEAATGLPEITHIREQIAELKADQVAFLHNHPSGLAESSHKDLRQARRLAQELGNVYAFDVIIDSGTYAYTMKNASGEVNYLDNVKLRSEDVGWDTSRPFDADPLYGDQTLAVEGRHALAASVVGRKMTQQEMLDWIEMPPEQRMLREKIGRIGRQFKSPNNWTTLIVERPSGTIAGITEYNDIHQLNGQQLTKRMERVINQFTKGEGGKVHMFVSEGNWYNNQTEAKEKIRSIIGEVDYKDIFRLNSVYGSVWFDMDNLEMNYLDESDLDAMSPDQPLTQVESVFPEGKGVWRGPTNTEAHILNDYTAEANRVAPGSYFVPHAKTTTSDTVNPDKVGLFSRLRGLFDPAASLKAKLDGYSPKMKLNLERTRREYMSGYRNLETMGPVGAEVREIAEHLLRLQEQGTARDLAALETHRKTLIDIAKQRAKGQKGAAREAVYSEISEQVYRFMEENTPIDDAEVAEIAQGWKETWRKILKGHDVYMMQLREKVEARGEKLLIYSASGNNTKPWMPILPGHVWIDDRKLFLRDSDGTELTLEQAIDESPYLYMPHVYPRSHWTELIKQVETGVLDALIEAEKDPTITEVPGFIIHETDSGRVYEFTRTGETFDSKQAAIAGARAFWNASYAIAQQQIAGKESDILGRFGNLEIARETNDKLYSRDVMTLLDHTAIFWRRFAEISVWGQVDPATGKHPRLQQYISRLEQTTLDADEHALKIVTDTLLSHEMFEKLPSFVEGESDAYHILRNWKHPVRKPEYWGNQPPPPPDHPVDIERMQRENPESFTPEIMESLQRIGLIEKKADGEWTIKGKTKAAKDTTFVKLMVPFFQTRQLREQSLMKIVQGLGHWEQLEPIESQSNTFWQLLNSITTMFTLGFGNAAQNIAEVPWLAAMSGSKPLAIGLRRFATDPEFRQMLPRFGATLNKARDYLAQGEFQNKYISMIGFTATEKWSRLMGTAVGWEAARDAIAAYIQNPNKNALARLQELNISPAAIEQYSEALSSNTAPALDELVKESEQRVLEGSMMLGGLRPPDTPDPSNPFVDLIGDEMAKAARYVSTRTFKGYNALSMPNFLTKKHPMIRTFFKFKAWAAQMHQFVWEQFRHATKQAKQGNLKPAVNLAIGAGFMMGSAAVMTSVFNALRGRERDEDRNRILESLAQSQAAGAISTIIEIAQISNQNPYRASQMISSFFSAPVIGITSRILGEAAAGDLGDAATEFGLRFPFVREIPRIQTLRD